MSQQGDKLESTTVITATDPSEDISQLVREQAALRRVATLVAHGASPPEVFEAVAAEVARLLESDFALLGRYQADATLAHLASHPLELLSQLGPQTILDGNDLASVVQSSGRPTSIDYDAAPGPVAALARELGVRCAVGAPILVDDQTWGIMAAGWAQPGKASSEAAERIAAFTDLIATAIANAQSREALAELAEEQAALRRVAMLVANDAPSTEIFSAVSEEVARLFDSAAGVGRFEPDQAVVYVGLMNIDIPIGSRWEFQEGMISAQVYRTGCPARVEEGDYWSSLEGELGESVRRHGFRSMVGSPIVVEGRLWGTIVVSSQDLLPSDTEERLEKFTELIAIAIANAEARQARAQLVEEQAALRRVATHVAEGARHEALFSAVAEEAAHVLDVALTAVVRYDAADAATLVGAWGKENPFPVGYSWKLAETNVPRLVAATSLPARVVYAEVPGEISTALTRGAGIHSAVGAPIHVGGELWGAMMALSTEEKPLPKDAETRLAAFTELIATAISNAAARTELIESRARLVAAGDEARRRIERDLHDGTQQRLVSLGLAARAAAAALPTERADVRQKFSTIATGLGEAVEELQELSRGIHPAILSDTGLGPALEALALRSPIPVELEVMTQDRFPEPLEVAVYFVASESLANAAKHSQASRIDIALTLEDEALLLSVRDDGIGGADPARGSGLVGLHDRVEALGGSLEIRSTAGDGTRLDATLPVSR